MATDDQKFDDDILTPLMVDIIKHADRQVMEKLGRPLYVSLFVWPSEAQELASYMGNHGPEERDAVAQVMIDLLIKWGYIEK
jgi:hypothetical protein